MDHSLGEIAYNAYGEHQIWLTFAGQQMPSWPSVRPDIQRAWDAAGRAVARHLAQARQATELDGLAADVPVHEA